MLKLLFVLISDSVSPLEFFLLYDTLDSQLLNTDLIPPDQKAIISYRIIGRHAWKKAKKLEIAEIDLPIRPKMSWSVPFTFPFAMVRRVKADLMAPMPMDLPSTVSVLDGFKEG